MYIKRDQSWRLHGGSAGAGGGGGGAGSEPPVMQRRSSLRPHNKVPAALRNEAHPLMKHPGGVGAGSGGAEASHFNSRTLVCMTVIWGKRNGKIVSKVPCMHTCKTLAASNARQNGFHSCAERCLTTPTCPGSV